MFNYLQHAKAGMVTIALFFAALCMTQELSGQKILELIDQDNVVYKDVQREAKNYFDVAGRGKGTGYKIYKRWEWRNSYRVMEDGRVASEARQAKILRNSRTKAKNGVSDWEQLGPTSWTNGSRGYNPGVGRITAVAVNPSNQNLIYVGSPTGGLWKTTNSGSTWTPLGDDFDNMDIWAIAFHPTNSNIVFYGNAIGEVWKTTNGGSTFTLVGRPGTSRVTTILFHPTNANIIHVAQRYAGLFRTTDGGSTWTEVVTAGMEDVVYKPGSTSTMYTCGGTFWKSTDGGANWSQITNGFQSTSRMKLAVSPANANYVYVLQSQGSGFGYLYRSTNSGTSFTTQSDASDGNFIGSQASRDMAIAVNTSNVNQVHIGGLDMYVSNNGGTSFTQECDWYYPSTAPGGSTSSNDWSYVHADIEVMQYINGNIYVGSDGGIWKSTNDGDDFSDLSFGLAVTQFYRIHSSQTDPYRVIGGTQDNGTFASSNAAFDWLNIRGADGMDCAVNPSNANIMWGCIQYGSMFKTTNGGASTSSLVTPPENGSGNWVTPIAVDPNNGNRLYAGYVDLYRHDNAATSGSWVNVSQNVSWSGKLRGIETCPSNSDAIYVFVSNTVYKSTNITSASPTWSTYTGFTGSINDVAVDPYDHNRLIVCTSSGRLYLSTDGLATKSEIQSGLPSSPFISCVLDRSSNGGMYVAIDGGVYFKNSTLTNWVTFNVNLPKVDIDEIELYYGNGGTKKVRVGTYGRGLWQSQMYDEADGAACADAGNRTVSGITGSSATLNWSAATGATNYDLRYRISGSPVWIDISNVTGTSRTLTGLTSSTTYNWQIRTSCGATNTAYVNGPNFTTPTIVTGCSGTISSYPYTNNFESSLGWSNTTSGDDFDWTRQTGGTTSSGTGPTGAAQGTWYAYMEVSAPNYPTKSAILNAPCFNLTSISNPTISFQYHMLGSNTGTLLLEASTNGSAWSPVWSRSGTQGSNWLSSTVSLNTYTNATQLRLRFRGTSGSSYQGDMCVDDIMVSGSVPCNAPGSRTISNITSNSARFNWAAVLGASNYDIQYRVNGTSTWSNITNATGTNYTILGLTANTTYNWRIRTSCGTTNSGYLSGSNFTTSAGSGCGLTVVGYPYTHNFDGQTLCGNTVYACVANGTCSLNGGWTNVAGDDGDWSVDDANSPSGNTGPTSDHTSGSGKYLFTEASSCYSKSLQVTSPCFNLSGMSTSTLSFWYHMWGAGTGSLSVQVSTNGGISWSGNVWSLSGDQGNSWQQASVNLDVYTGQTIRIRFTGVTGTAYTSDIALDDVRMEASADCPALNFNTNAPITYGGTQDQGLVTVQDAGATLYLRNNAWKAINYNYTVTSNTMIEFDFRSTIEGEIHGIGFDNDNSISSNRTFKVHGTQGWGYTNYDNYSPTAWKTYTIPVGTFYTGVFNRLTFTCDHDGGAKNGNAYFRNVKVFEGSCGPAAPSGSSEVVTPVLGLEEELGENIAVYPNPFNEELYIDVSKAFLEKKGKVILYDMVGKKVYEKPFDNITAQLKITPEVPAGTYLIRLEADGQSAGVKVVKTN
ncbi:MAG: fibronectin type III domain-containing protein [Bacteroidia bacterium]